MTINERIGLIVNELGMNKNSFSVKIGTNPTVVHNIINARNRPGYEMLHKIILSFDNINAEWLLTGNGEMLKSDDKSKLKKSIEHIHKGIPLIPVEAMAGYANGDVQVMDYDIQEDYIITPELENRGIKYLIRASGSSMTPKYNNGDLLACRPITDSSFIQWGKVYVLDTDQGPLVKRLYPCNPQEDDCLECRSDNFEKYPPFKITKTSIRRIAIVMGVLRME